MDTKETLAKVKVVWLILDSQPEEALRLLCNYYNVDIPKLKVGLPKGHSKVAGCYVHAKKTIYAANRETLYNPFVILHEFYHHLRYISGKHRGNEKHADSFASGFIEAYNRFVKDRS